MNTTENFEWRALRESWQDDGVYRDLSATLLEARMQLDHRRAVLIAVGEVAIAATGLTAGGWLARSADIAISRVGIGTVIFTLFVCFLAVYARRRDAALGDDQSVTGMLQTTQSRLRRDLRHTRAGYLACIAGVVFALFVCASPGSSDRPKSRVTVALLIGLTWSGAFGIGLLRRERRLKSELQSFERLDHRLLVLD